MAEKTLGRVFFLNKNLLGQGYRKQVITSSWLGLLGVEGELYK